MAKSNTESIFDFDRLLAEHGSKRRFHEFQKLAPFRVREILLVASLYDSYILDEEGRLYEGLLSEYVDLNLSNAPGLTRASNGQRGIELATGGKSFDLIITTMRLGDIDAPEMVRKLREQGIDTPVVLLAYDSRELSEMSRDDELALFEWTFVWQGDFRILVAIIKLLEDRRNVENDSLAVGLQSIIVVEDNAAFYSSFLPLIYTEVIRHHLHLISDSVNMAHRLLRMRARPKVLLCTTYEQAMEYYRAYEDCILGVISDIEFPREGKSDPQAGLQFVREVKSSYFDIPILLESDNPEHEAMATQLGVSFLYKSSPLFLHELSRFIVRHFAFGDFVFRASDGSAIGRAADLRALEEQLAIIPEEVLEHHAKRNHFSYWLKARTEFWLADKLRPRRVSDYVSLGELRQHLLGSLKSFRRERELGLISDFDPRTFVVEASFSRIGGGSLGGKARGLAFIAGLLNSFAIRNHFEGVEIAVPPAVVLGTDLFDQFMDDNDLSDFAIQVTDEDELYRRFLEAPLPPDLVDQLSGLLELVHKPLAVRSSSLLEDSKYQPFAGIYRTYMIPNSHRDRTVRLWELTNAVKAVYASTFTQRAKGYFDATQYRLEDERMAVIIQLLVGNRHESRFYPDFSGVVRSHNYYPSPPMKSSDGIASIALGLGKTVTDGGLTVRFCPRYPQHIVQFSDPESTLQYSQKQFYALELDPGEGSRDFRQETVLMQYDLATAERDGTLAPLASTYSVDNHALYEGVAREGTRVVTFAPLINGKSFPLPEILKLIMELGSWGMNAPVEIEFAVNLDRSPEQRSRFAFLQVRPLVVGGEGVSADLGSFSRSQLVCQSTQVLGNGTIDDISDIVLVNRNKFERGKTSEIAVEIGNLNRMLREKRRPYLLIGPGRWGTADPWLGIPVSWDQISGARVIIESNFDDFQVTPSQGTHFFQNITSFRIGYFSVNEDGNEFVDWEWLDQQPVTKALAFTSHICLEHAVRVLLDGKKNSGVILKPSE